MTFDEILDQARRRCSSVLGRLTYRSIQRQFNLDAGIPSAQCLERANIPIHRRIPAESMRRRAHPEPARVELSTAMALYRAMDMTFWLPETTAMLAQVEG